MLTIWGGTLSTQSVTIGTGGLHMLSSRNKTMSTVMMNIQPNSTSIIFPGTRATIPIPISLWTVGKFTN